MQNYLNIPIIGYGFTPNGATVAANNGTIPVGTSLIWAMPAPTDSFGGGITVDSFKVYTNGTVATNVWNLALVTISTANAVAGTLFNIASAAQFGGTSYMNTGTAISSGWVDTDDSVIGLAIEVKQVAVLAVGTTNVHASIGWQQGRG
jgi:hypothetical protein